MESPEPEGRLPLEVTRDEVISKLHRKNFEVLVVGGGIIGASVARLAAFNGLRTALLERLDYASGTSSRSSKMLHGGLRYLEMGDLRQVFEGLRARKDLLDDAPHLAHASPFHVPLFEGERFARLKLGIGLKLYDLLAQLGRGSLQSSHWISDPAKINSALQAGAHKLAGCYEFFDGIMDDARLVQETILAARQEGAVCLNYAKVITIDSKRPGEIGVGWNDAIGGKSYESTAGIVINCAGPWAPSVGRVKPGSHLGEIRYSRGSHILFNQPWSGPALLFPQKGGTNYFIWPHAAGTMVGTTEREVTTLEDDPMPTPDEIDEILERLQRDIPEAGLTRARAHYCFAGVRTLPAQSRAGRTAKLSRKHRWVHHEGVLSLVGGKFTSAAWTAHEGMRQVYKLAGILTPLTPVQGRKFPGAGNLESSTEEFSSAAKEAGLSASLIQNCIRRFGSRVRYIPQCESWGTALGKDLIRGELELSIRTEQVVCVEDLMRRRLGLEYTAGNGLNELDSICKSAGVRLTDHPERGQAGYERRMNRIAQMLKGA